MKKMILIALAFASFTVNAQTKICRLHVTNLDVALSHDRAFLLEARSNFGKKGYDLIEAEQVTAGDYIIEEAYQNNGVTTSLDYRSGGTYINRAILSKMRDVQEKKDLLSVPYSFQHNSYSNKKKALVAMRALAKKIPKCKKLP